MKDIAPSVEEIKKVINIFDTLSFKEKQKLGVFKDKRKMIMKERMTLVLMLSANNLNKEKIWKYCKKIASYSHAPVELKEYQRMLPYADDKDIINVILNALEQNPFPFSNEEFLLDIVGYFYTIATISQSPYRRNDIISLLHKIANFIKENKPEYLNVFKRNMEVLKKSFLDLDIEI